MGKLNFLEEEISKLEDTATETTPNKYTEKENLKKNKQHQ